MNLLFVTSEISPLAKVGGLGDFVNFLTKHLYKNGIESRVVLPKYQCVYDYIEQNRVSIIKKEEITVLTDKGEVKSFVEEIRLKGITYYLLDNPSLYKRDGIYFDEKTKMDYMDSLERVVYFNMAIFEIVKVFDYKPDIIHCTDWPTALVPAYLKTIHKLDLFFKNTKVIFTIHNLAYQGIYPVEQYPITRLDWKYFNVNYLEFYGHFNLMKCGIIFSDIATTVSESYAKEILTPEYGSGLDGVLCKKAEEKKLRGILSGVDYDEWDPSKDIYLKTRYNINYSINSLENKTKIKQKFLMECGVQNPEIEYPLIGMISRLVDQKGFDLIFNIIDDLLKRNLYFVILGKGRIEYEENLKRIKNKYPNKMFVFLEFNVELSHIIEAASDIYLMPSRYEPIGLNQLISLKYGTVPIVRKTGGLADTIKNELTGFVYNDYNPESLLATIDKALNIYKNEKEMWIKIVKNCMMEDWSWNRLVKNYIDLYEEILG